jgi:hypothetical protein
MTWIKRLMASTCVLWRAPWADGTLGNFKEWGLMYVASVPVLVPSVQHLGARPISDRMNLLANIGNRFNFAKGEQNDN